MRSRRLGDAGVKVCAVGLGGWINFGEVKKDTNRGHCGQAKRRAQAELCCVVCGHQTPADVNAALNIRDRAACQRAYGIQPSG